MTVVKPPDKSGFEITVWQIMDFFIGHDYEDKGSKERTGNWYTLFKCRRCDKEWRSYHANP